MQDVIKTKPLNSQQQNHIQLLLQTHFYIVKLNSNNSNWSLAAFTTIC